MIFIGSLAIDVVDVELTLPYGDDSATLTGYAFCVAAWCPYFMQDQHRALKVRLPFTIPFEVVLFPQAQTPGVFLLPIYFPNLLGVALLR